MSDRNNEKTRSATLGADYHSAKTVEELTAINVKTIAELENAAQQKCSRADRIAALITAFCAARWPSSGST